MPTQTHSWTYHATCFLVHLSHFECQSLWFFSSATRNYFPELRSSCVRRLSDGHRSVKTEGQLNQPESYIISLWIYTCAVKFIFKPPASIRFPLGHQSQVQQEDNKWNPDLHHSPRHYESTSTKKKKKKEKKMIKQSHHSRKIRFQD